jgi:hypothetical protein
MYNYKSTINYNCVPSLPVAHPNTRPSIHPSFQNELDWIILDSFASFSCNVRLVFGQGRQKVTRFFSLPKTQSNQGFPSRLFVRDADHKISGGVQDGFHKMFQFVVSRHQINAAQGKQFAFRARLAIMRVGKNQQQSISTTLQPQTDALQRFGQWPAISAAYLWAWVGVHLHMGIWTWKRGRS